MTGESGKNKLVRMLAKWGTTANGNRLQLQQASPQSRGNDMIRKILPVALSLVALVDHDHDHAPEGDGPDKPDNLPTKSAPEWKNYQLDAVPASFGITGKPIGMAEAKP
jgi:hypothetical protein